MIKIGRPGGRFSQSSLELQRAAKIGINIKHLTKDQIKNLRRLGQVSAHYVSCF
jgi:hypothetical protein